MTEAEAWKILTFLRAAFPRQEIGEETLTVYLDALKPLEADQVLRAARYHVACEKFFPTLSELLKPVAEELVGMSAEEAWLEVMHAISAWGRYRGWFWPDMPLLQLAVDAIGKENLCNSTNLAVERAHFMRIYESYRASELARAKVAPLEGRKYQPRLGAYVSVGDALRQLYLPPPSEDDNE